MNGNTADHVRNVIQCFRYILTKISFAEHYDGLRATLLGKKQVSLNPTKGKVRIERCHQKHLINVRAHDLLFSFGAGNFANEPAAARKYGVNCGLSIAVAIRDFDGYPVAYSRTVLTALGIVSQASGDSS